MLNPEYIKAVKVLAENGLMPFGYDWVAQNKASLTLSCGVYEPAINEYGLWYIVCGLHKDYNARTLVIDRLHIPYSQDWTNSLFWFKKDEKNNIIGIKEI